MTHNHITFPSFEYTLLDGGLLDSLLNSRATFPPHDELRISPTELEIRVAAAGYAKDTISVKVEKGILSIAASNQPPLEKSIVELSRGISRKPFNLQYRLYENAEVKDASFEDGIIKVSIQQIVVEKEKPKMIALR